MGILKDGGMRVQLTSTPQRQRPLQSAGGGGEGTVYTAWGRALSRRGRDDGAVNV